MKKVKPGLEVLLEREMSLVRGRRVGVVTNHSAVTSDITHVVDALLGAGVNLVALYGPEHGVRGDVADGQEIASGTDPRTGLPVHSLYGPTRKPTREMLAGVDVMLYDLQDIGARFYTYTYTMSYVMQACAEDGKQFVVLDRPNPINGLAVEGNVLHTDFASFIGLHPIPIRHGMTVAELATFFNDELGFGADLEVVLCQGWKRAMWFDQTGLPWVMPSPNMPTLDAALLYPGLCLIEGTNVSEARGTSKPFEMLGAPWADGYELAARLNAIELPGVRFRPVHFMPKASKHQDQACSGVQAHVMDRDAVRAVEVGLHVVKALQDLHPDDFQFRPPGPSGKHFFDLLTGTDETRLAIQAGTPVEEIVGSWADGLQEFMRARQRHVLYA